MIYLMVLGYLLIVAIELSDLIADPLRAATVTDAEMIRLMGEIEYVRNLLAAVAAARAVTQAQAEPEDQLLSINEAAAVLGMSVKWLYRNSSRLGGLKLGSRLKFPRKAIDSYISRQRRTR
jgi:predicted DNA-binding transcriptional regulator AlpA